MNSANLVEQFEENFVGFFFSLKNHESYIFYDSWDHVLGGDLK